MEDRAAGDARGEARDLRLAEEGLEEADADTAVAGVTGAES